LTELNDDQFRVIEALTINTLSNPSTYIADHDNGILGLPYKEIMNETKLSREKTLLSLGALEARGLVHHQCGIQRQTIDYLGRSNVEIAGQKIVRIFSLTPRGRKIIKE
jgi:hypothetical protein